MKAPAASGVQNCLALMGSLLSKILVSVAAISPELYQDHAWPACQAGKRSKAHRCHLFQFMDNRYPVNESGRFGLDLDPNPATVHSAAITRRTHPR